MTKGLSLNNLEYLETETISGQVRFCDGKNVKSFKSERISRKHKTILVIDLGVTNCKELLSNPEMQHADLAGLVILDSAELNHHSIKANVGNIKRYAVVSVLHEDVDNFLKSVHRQEPSLILWFDTLGAIFDNCNTGEPQYSVITCSYQGAECQELVMMDEKYNCW